MLVLLIVLAAFFVAYYGVEKFGFLPGLLPSSKQEAARKSAQTTVASKTDTKGVGSAASGPTKQKPTVPSKPAAQKPVAPVSKPTQQKPSNNPAKPTPQKRVVPASKPAEQSPVATSPEPVEKEPVAVSPKTLPTKVIVAKQAVREKSPAPGREVQPREKGGRRATIQPKKATSYPYSIYLGSYRSIEKAKRAVSQYQEKGFSPYWVKVHLGKRGVWFRVFEGCFENNREAEAFINQKQLKDASVKTTKYTNLIGAYSTERELRTKSKALLELGYCPYAIAGPDGKVRLYTGAFLTKAGAEAQHRELTSLGVQNRVVVR